MQYTYFPTLLEEWVTKLYKTIGINHPEDLDETYICRKLNIYLKYKNMESHYLVTGRYQEITINAALPLHQKREAFYHELCHILRHTGNQITMPDMLRVLQERDARHFVRYAALPYHLIVNYDIYATDATVHLSNVFGVTEELCQERIDKIKTNRKVKVVREGFNEYRFSNIVPRR
ncbi:ImmA/IrrE family metallo-endopeptidase [Bacillus tianshenii]|nr:ImmA/IrrE family metallo-endopeptidase [Bacillus tianshenii]